MNMTGYVLFWYLLGLKLTWGRAHKTRSWCLLGVTFKKSDEHFNMGVPPGLKDATLVPWNYRSKCSKVWKMEDGLGRHAIYHLAVTSGAASSREKLSFFIVYVNHYWGHLDLNFCNQTNQPPHPSTPPPYQLPSRQQWKNLPAKTPPPCLFIHKYPWLDVDLSGSPQVVGLLLILRRLKGH